MHWRQQVACCLIEREGGLETSLLIPSFLSLYGENFPDASFLLSCLSRRGGKVIKFHKCTFFSMSN